MPETSPDTPAAPRWADSGHQELEVKLLGTPQILQQVREGPLIRALAVSPPVTRTLVNVYYDTPARWFAAHALTLRVRSDGERHVQGLKSRTEARNGLFRRWEWERAIPSAAPDMTLLAAVLADGFSIPLPAGIAPAFETRFTRIECELEVPCKRGLEIGRIAVAFDEGAIVAGRRVAAVAEIELELLSGPEEALTDLGSLLVASYALRPGHTSKAQRGYLLAD
jgi:triphosphatase